MKLVKSGVILAMIGAIGIGNVFANDVGDFKVKNPEVVTIIDMDIDETDIPVDLGKTEKAKTAKKADMLIDMDIDETDIAVDLGKTKKAEKIKKADMLIDMDIDETDIPVDLGKTEKEKKDKKAEMLIDLED